MSADDQDTSPTNRIEAFTALTKILPNIVPGALRKTNEGLSTGIEGILNVLNIHGLEVWNKRRELVARRNMRKLVKEFECVDQNDLMPAAMEIETPILKKLSTTSDERLSEILIKLLIAAASKSNCHLVHPSMITVAENLSPDEALLMKYWSLGTNSLPMIEVNYIRNRFFMRGPLYYTRVKYFSALHDWEGLANPENIEFYIGNLISLGLFYHKYGHVPIEYEDGSTGEADPDYAQLEKNALTRFPLTGIYDKRNIKISTNRIIFRPTEKGALFISIINKIDLDEDA